MLSSACNRRVSPEDVEACEVKFNKSKVVHSIIRHVSETTGTLPEQLYKVRLCDVHPGI